MASPNANNMNAGVGSGGAAPPAVYDPYQAIIDELPLPDSIFSLLAPTFGRLNFQLERDDQSIKDYSSQTALTHYRITAGTGKIVLLHVGGRVTADPFGQRVLLPIIFPFLAQSIGIFIFSEVEALAFKANDLISAWQQERPTLKANFITLPKLQDLETATSEAERDRKIRDLLSLDELLISAGAAAHTLSFEQLIEEAYRKCDPALLNGVPDLSDKLTEDDRKAIVDFIGPQALGPPLHDVKKYFLNLLSQLGLEGKLLSYLFSSLTGDSYNDAEKLLYFLEEKTYQNGARPGYDKILGYLLKLLADNGGGKKVALIVFKYRLITDMTCLKALVSTYS